MLVYVQAAHIQRPEEGVGVLLHHISPSMETESLIEPGASLADNKLPSFFSGPL